MFFSLFKKVPFETWRFVMQVNKIIVNQDYQDLYNLIFNIFKDDEEVAVLFDRRIKEEKSNYKH